MIQGLFQHNNVNLFPSNEEEFEALLSAGKVEEARGRMDTRGASCRKAIAEYDPRSHEIMKRQDKQVTDKYGNLVKVVKQWKLAVPYQVYINEVALVFLFGQPVKWQQQSEGTDDAFKKFQEVIKSTRFNAKIRQCKRIAGAETESAMLFRAYRDDDGQPDLQVRVLAWSKGDGIYTRFDQYDNMIAFGWSYQVKERQDRVEEHFDVYTKKEVYYCVNHDGKWEVTRQTNIIGKIPVILFRQEKEWAGVEHLIHREEYIASHTADTNDYFADPIMIMSANIIKNMPEKKDAAKTLVTDDTEGGVNNAARYLTWDNAPQAKTAEISWLQDQILSKSFTPDIKLDTLKSLGNLSGKALRTVMLLADMKAGKRKEVYDEMLDRTASLITTIIGNVLEVRLKSQCDKLTIQHIWQEPLGDDLANNLENIIKASDGGILSQESAVELNPLVRDSIAEKKRLKKENGKRSENGLLFASGAASAYPKPAASEEEEDNKEGEEQDKDKAKGGDNNVKANA